MDSGESLLAPRLPAWLALYVASEQLAFAREHDAQRVIVLVNAAAGAVRVPVPAVVPLWDVLNDEAVPAGQSVEVPGCWGRVLVDGRPD